MPGQPESSRGSRQFESLAAALEAAQTQFGLADSDWLINEHGGIPAGGDIANLRDAVLNAHGIDPFLPFEGLVAVHPHVRQIVLEGAGSADMFVILDSEDGDGYAVFYDPVDGSCGLASVDSGVYRYIGDYGSLWESIEAL